MTVKKSLHKLEDTANFPLRSFFCYLAREIFLPREGDHFCYFCVFDYFDEINIEILLHHFALQEVKPAFASYCFEKKEHLTQISY